MSTLPLRVVRSSGLALLCGVFVARGSARAEGAGASLAAPFQADGAAPASPGAPPTRLVVTPSGHAYLVVNVVPAARDGAVVCDVLYLAGDDAVELARPGAQERLAAAAAELAAAFAPLVEVGPVERLSISAIFGRAGRNGIAARLWFVRRERRWYAEARAFERAAAQVPAVPAKVLRDAGMEATAHATAAGFVSDADHGDLDSAWARTSAVVRAAISRAEFDRSLLELTRPSGVDGELFLSFPVTTDRLLPGACAEAWVARATAQGPIVEALSLRLDDDLRWRVAGVVQLARTPAAAETAPPTPAPATAAARAL